VIFARGLREWISADAQSADTDYRTLAEARQTIVAARAEAERLGWTPAQIESIRIEWEDEDGCIVRVEGGAL
jgi:hypothetical protein